MPRTRKCKAPDCETRYEPISQFQKACSVKCALIVNQIASKARKRAEIREARKRLKTRSEWLRDAQKSFNAYIRERDKGSPCISCGKMSSDEPLTGGYWDAGHYRTVGACPELRFHEDNCHRQHKHCNNYKSGDIVNYRKNLIERIGLERVEFIEGPHEPKRYRIDDLKALRDEYKQKLKDLSL